MAGVLVGGGQLRDVLPSIALRPGCLLGHGPRPDILPSEPVSLHFLLTTVPQSNTASSSRTSIWPPALFPQMYMDQAETSLGHG